MLAPSAVATDWAEPQPVPWTNIIHTRDSRWPNSQLAKAAALCKFVCVLQCESSYCQGCHALLWHSGASHLTWLHVCEAILLKDYDRKLTCNWQQHSGQTHPLSDGSLVCRSLLLILLLLVQATQGCTNAKNALCIIADDEHMYNSSATACTFKTQLQDLSLGETQVMLHIHIHALCAH